MTACHRYFLPRDALHKHGICCRAVPVCLSVRTSRSCIVSKRVNISQTFSLSGSYTMHSGFSTLNLMVIFRPGPTNGLVEYKKYEKIAIFDQYLALC